MKGEGDGVKRLRCAQGGGVPVPGLATRTAGHMKGSELRGAT